MLAGIVLLAWLVGALLGLWPLLPSFSGLAPQPQSYAGTGISRVGPITVSYVDGKQGLAILVWCDISGQAGGSSGNSTSGGAGSAEYASTVRAADGRQVAWTWLTPDNAGGKFTLNGTDYDLAEGRLFLVSTKDGKAVVRQLQRDFSQVRPDSLQRFADSDPDVARFITEAAPPTELQPK
jgi:hypothetical protein